MLPAYLSRGNRAKSYYFLICLLVFPLAGILALYLKSKGSSLDKSSTIGYNGGYIVIVFFSDNYFPMNSKRSGHLWKNYSRLNVGFMPTVRLAKTEKSINDEFLTPHYSLVKPLIDKINADET